MNPTLRDACRRFLERKPPEELGYVSDSIAEIALRLYAQGEPLDGELLDLLEIAIADSRETAEALGGEAGAYLRESAALLEALARETG